MILIDPTKMPDVKSVFGTGPRKYMMQFDYGQVELFALGIVAQDDTLLRALMDTDFHTKNAQDFFGKAKPSKQERTAAKAISFGIVYGAGAATIAEREGLAEPLVRQLIDDFYTAYSGVERWHDALIERSEKESKYRGHTTKATHGAALVETPVRSWAYVMPWGKRYLFIEEPMNKYTKNLGFKPTKLKNYPVQGCASDLIRFGLSALMDKGYVCQAQVHDSVLIYGENILTMEDEVQDALLHGVKDIAQSLGMYWPDWLELKVDCEVGKWLDKLEPLTS